jgi:hypothetical protein
MGRKNVGTVVLCLSVGAACSASSSNSKPAENDASAPDDASAVSEGGSPGPSDAGPRDAPASPESAASDDGSMDATLQDCPPPKVPRWDGAVPPASHCSSPDDTDHDGYPDCIDGCPYDATKIAPGACGCNVPDVDSDGDGVADCIDGCPQDPNNTQNEQCGCTGEPGLSGTGTPCRDPACPQAGATCNGAGVCGDRSSCSPCPSGRYVVIQDGRGFWFCGTSFPPLTGPGCVEEDGGGGAGATRMAAQAACAAKGLTLARIESSEENNDVAQLMTARLWIGANDLQTPGQWFWSSATSDSDTLFWSGGLDGSRQNDLFFDWANSAPGDKSCASISSVNGSWSDTDCSETLGYICSIP